MPVCHAPQLSHRARCRGRNRPTIIVGVPNCQGKSCERRRVEHVATAPAYQLRTAKAARNSNERPDSLAQALAIALGRKPVPLLVKPADGGAVDDFERRIERDLSREVPRHIKLLERENERVCCILGLGLKRVTPGPELPQRTGKIIYSTFDAEVLAMSLHEGEVVRPEGSSVHSSCGDAIAMVGPFHVVDPAPALADAEAGGRRSLAAPVGPPPLARAAAKEPILRAWRSAALGPESCCNSPEPSDHVSDPEPPVRFARTRSSDALLTICTGTIVLTCAVFSNSAARWSIAVGSAARFAAREAGPPERSSDPGIGANCCGLAWKCPLDVSLTCLTPLSSPAEAACRHGLVSGCEPVC